MKTKEHVRRLKIALEKRRTALRQSLDNDIAGLKAGTGVESGDAAEIALDDVFDLVSSQLAESESRELERIEVALEQMRRGTYGKCGSCEGAIPLARLQALPYATRCVKCEREAERRGQTGASDMRWASPGGSDDEGEPNNPFLDHVADIF